jgi:hypothetical protein
VSLAFEPKEKNDGSQGSFLGGGNSKQSDAGEKKASDKKQEPDDEIPFN